MRSGSTVPITTALCNLLAQEESACRSLLETVQEERRAIRTLAITEFHTINGKRLAVLEQLRVLARECDLLVQQFAQTEGSPQSSLSLQRVIDLLTDHHSNELRGQYKRLMAAAKLVREEIKQNVVLIEGIRGFIDSALSAGKKVVPGLDLYNGGGQSTSVLPTTALFYQQG